MLTLVIDSEILDLAIDEGVVKLSDALYASKLRWDDRLMDAREQLRVSLKKTLVDPGFEADLTWPLALGLRRLVQRLSAG